LRFQLSHFVNCFLNPFAKQIHHPFARRRRHEDFLLPWNPKQPLRISDERGAQQCGQQHATRHLLGPDGTRTNGHDSRDNSTISPLMMVTLTPMGNQNSVQRKNSGEDGESSLSGSNPAPATSAARKVRRFIPFRLGTHSTPSA